jgi:hypothetical protein
MNAFGSACTLSIMSVVAEAGSFSHFGPQTDGGGVTSDVYAPLIQK